MTIFLCWLAASIVATALVAYLAEHAPVTDEYDFDHDRRRFERPVPQITLRLVRG